MAGKVTVVSKENGGSSGVLRFVIDVVPTNIALLISRKSLQMTHDLLDFARNRLVLQDDSFILLSAVGNGHLAFAWKPVDENRNLIFRRVGHFY